MKNSGTPSRLSKAASSRISIETTSDVGSSYSNFSAATTIKGSILPTKTKGSLLKLKAEPKYSLSDKYSEQKAVHYEALASYFSMR
ncbi:hypothetical protein N7478_009555 [Penicillium angulare]|uniref:uncharacterized protein n=1 Tax=Penicillium angulare TaxID=116970 RepID=UPI002540210F|nr:uncharacterized protein N7478_009555 [Penicillium angulare]KAJ5266747.1 hypothetical protein N7478_009555 [Penicillium angulare]